MTTASPAAMIRRELDDARRRLASALRHTDFNLADVRASGDRATGPARRLAASVAEIVEWASAVSRLVDALAIAAAADAQDELATRAQQHWTVTTPNPGTIT